MKTIVTAMLMLVALLLISCSANPTEGCRITHVNGVELKPAVQFPANAEPVAMNPGDSYQVWCVREINRSSVGDIITEDRQTLRIASLPADAELEIYPDEREAVYRGHPVPSSTNVWNGFEEASNSPTPNNWMLTWVGAFILSVIIVIALFIWFRRGGETEPDAIRY